MLLIVLSCELTDFTAIVYTKENVAAKALADQLCDLAPPTLGRLGRLIGRIEEGKGAAYASQIDVRRSDRNRIISNRSILIATGGSATAEMARCPRGPVGIAALLCRGQTAGGGSIPRWSASKPQVR